MLHAHGPVVGQLAGGDRQNFERKRSQRMMTSTKSSRPEKSKIRQVAKKLAGKSQKIRQATWRLARKLRNPAEIGGSRKMSPESGSR